MIYDYLGNTVYNSVTSHFSDNIELDYAYDSVSDANYSVIRVFRKRKDGTIQKPIIIYPGFTKTETVASQGWELTINAGLGWDSAIDGIAISNGEVISANPASYHSGAIPLIIDSDGNFDTVSASATASDAITAGAVYATCGFCPIIVDYDEVEFPTVDHVSHFTDNAQRQIIGQFGNGDYAIVTCAGRSNDNSDGWTLAEAQTICKKLGLKFAYNLDGGTSTSTYIKEHAVYDFMKGTSRTVPSFIVFGGLQSTVDVSSATLLKSDVINGLTSTVTDKPLSGNMGRVLNEKVEAIIGGVIPKGDIVSSNLPEASDENKGWQYYCTDLDKFVISDGTQWVQFSGNGSGGGSGDVNVIESISVNNVAQTVDTNKNVNITVPTVTTATAIADNDTGYTTGDQVYDYAEAKANKSTTISSSSTDTQYPSALAVKTYVDAHGFDPSSMSTVTGNISINGAAQSDWNQSDSSAADYIKNKPTVPVVAQAIASGDNGYVTGDMVYDTLGDLETFLSNY